MSGEQTPDARIEAAADAMHGAGIYGPGWNEGMLTSEQYRELAEVALAAADRAAPPAPPDALGPPKCGDCAKPAVWVRRTQFSGDHYFCDEHGREQEDFGKDDPSYVWRTAPTTAAAAPPAIPREPTVEQIEVAALAWRNWPDWGDYPWENVNAERHWAERALRAVFAIAGGAPAIPPRRPVNANGDENYLEAPDLPLSDEMHERVAAAIDAGFGSAWNGMSESVKQWAWRSVVAAFESAPAIPPRPRDDEIAYFIADAGQWRKEAEENERHADALAEALRSLLDAAEGFFDPSVIENQARKVLGDYDAHTEAKG